MINRELYMEQITPFIDKPFVKVITGIRRCGKSVVLRLIREELLRRGVSEDYRNAPDKKKVQSFLITCLNLLIRLVIILQIHNNRIKQEVTGNERKQT